jgi:hypothetical protein
MQFGIPTKQNINNIQYAKGIVINIEFHNIHL